MAQWDAFISYARSASTLEAQKLQTAIQTFAKPWYRLRTVRVFRDDSSMSANPGLWSTIEEGLREARWLVVLLSPAAARSEYVANEIGWWLRHKDAAGILLVHDEGTLGWDRVRNDFSAATDCVPAPLRGAFREEPRWTDLSWFDAPGSSGPSDPRFKEKVADLASAIRGIPRDELLGEDVAQHKRSWRLARAAIGTLSLLLIAAIVASVLAIAQRNEVLRQANALLARQLGATSDSLLSRDLRRAQLLAAQAYRTDPTAETRAALLRAGLASPALRRFLTFPAAITSVESSGSGRFVAVGLADGQVFSWDVAAAAPIARFTMPQRIRQVGISDDGTIVAAVDGTGVYVATGDQLGSVALPEGQQPQLVAVNPAGSGIIVASTGESSMVTLVDLAARSQRTVPDPAEADNNSTLTLQFIGNDQVLLAGPHSETRSFPAFDLLAEGVIFYGARPIAGRISADGRFATATNGSSEVRVWRVHTDQDEPERYAVVPMANETASALNHDGTLLAVADASGIHLAKVRATSDPAGYGHSADPPRVFVGTTEVNAGGLLFLGRYARLVAASGSDLSLWDPDAIGRSSAMAPLDLAGSCTACGSPTVAVSPDGTTMAVRDGERSRLSIGGVPGRSGFLLAEYHPSELVGEFAPPVWLPDGTVLLVTPGASEGTLRGVLPGLPDGVVGWAIGRPDDRIVNLRVSGDQNTVLVVGADGHIGRYELRTGALLAEVTVPPGEANWFDAAISEDLASVAFTPQDGLTGVRVVDAATGADRFTLAEPGQDVSRTLFARGSLWVRQNSGTIERRDPLTGALQRQLPGRFTVQTTGAMSEADGLVAIPTDLGIALYDAAAETLLGTVALPAGWEAVRHGVTLSPDASALVMVFEAKGDDSASGRAVSTRLDPESLVATACRTSGGNLSADDWRTLVGGAVPEDLSCR
ncbi:TIR domain-containing protein [Micropruina sonneratiae]|uniref:TIR domain-containing protein n=1 Tax=Micropruina sonneratiae TaxID=2986940 RepID=UPI0022280DDE|nr:TIR domain-containing protein [Micropruina sp. KQZ13P-5]MCW3157353.1 TIR domain-containing protein [Micropruina sp. KQZ13P-5]